MYNLIRPQHLISTAARCSQTQRMDSLPIVSTCTHHLVLHASQISLEMVRTYAIQKSLNLIHPEAIPLPEYLGWACLAWALSLWSSSGQRWRSSSYQSPRDRSFQCCFLGFHSPVLPEGCECLATPGKYLSPLCLRTLVPNRSYILWPLSSLVPHLSEKHRWFTQTG